MFTITGYSEKPEYIIVPGHSKNKQSGRRHPLFHLTKIKIAQYPLLPKAKNI